MSFARSLCMKCQQRRTNATKSEGTYSTKTKWRSCLGEPAVFSFAGVMYMIGRPSTSNPFSTLDPARQRGVSGEELVRADARTFCPSHSRRGLPQEG
jgi:hypothetical protein